MGNQQPKKINKVSKTQVDMGALKAKIHLQLMRDRKNGQVIKGEKQLIAKIKAKSRNKTQEALIAERVVNGLKYAQACNQLMAYAASIRGQANFLAENINNPQKLQPWLPQIYSLIYAADLLGLSSLKQFKDLMRALNDPMTVNKYINPEILQLLTPTPSPYEVNVYFLEFSERNNISIEEINLPGHKVSPDFKPPQPNKDDSFADIQKKLAEELNKANINGNNQGGQGGQANFIPGQGWQQGNQNNQGWGQGGQGGQGGQTNFTPGQGQGGGFVPVKTPSYYDLDKNRDYKPTPVQNNVNPYGIRQTFDPRSNQNKLTQPKLYDNIVPSNPQQKPKQFYNQSRVSIRSIDDIDYFPEIEPPAKVIGKDDEFDNICDILRPAM